MISKVELFARVRRDARVEGTHYSLVGRAVSAQIKYIQKIRDARCITSSNLRDCE